MILKEFLDTLGSGFRNYPITIFSLSKRGVVGSIITKKKNIPEEAMSRKYQYIDIQKDLKLRGSRVIVITIE